MLINININNCKCLKNKKIGCIEQCPFNPNGGEYCKKHSKSIFKTVNDYNLIIIQSYIRCYLIQCKIHRIYGPAYKNPLLSHDNIDPISLEQIWDIKDGTKVNICEIPRYLIFSFTDTTNKLRIYNILSLLKITQYDNKDPITRLTLDFKVTTDLNERIQFMKKNNLWTNDFLNFENHTKSQNIQNMVTDITLLLNNHSIYVNNNDILDIQKSKLIQLYSECRSILYHSDNKHIINKLSENKLFFQLKSVYLTKISNLVDLQTIIFTEILKIINSPVLQSDIKHVSYIILGALMYVSPNIYNIYTNNLQFT